MFTRKRPVVQLTSLLDLLFIMIFISLTSPMGTAPEPPPPKPVVKPSGNDQVDKMARELAKFEAENQQYAANNDPLTSTDDPKENIGEYRKLFVANVYYKHGKSAYRYTETILYSADEQSGLYEYRINLKGAGIVEIKDKPLTEADADQIKTCKQVVLTKDKIYQDCSVIFRRRKIIDCDRTDEKFYLCKEQLLRFTANDSRKVGNWEYKMELVKIYDSTLLM